MNRPPKQNPNIILEPKESFRMKGECAPSLPAVRDEPQPTSNHTPGPWTLSNTYRKQLSTDCSWDSVVRQISVEGAQIAIVHSGNAENEANARLIASAPALLRSNGELLAALKSASYWLTKYAPNFGNLDEVEAETSAAIRNAEAAQEEAK